MVIRWIILLHYVNAFILLLYNVDTPAKHAFQRGELKS